MAMHIKFWGTRGSLPKSGPGTTRYGGNTSCVEVRSDRGTLVMIDCGSGAHAFGQKLLSDGNLPKRGHMLISHTHWDHIQGFPFFAPLFLPEMEWDIYGPTGIGTSLKDALAGQMQYTYFPVSMENLGAKIRFHELVEGDFEIDDITVRSRYLNHPALTLAYRLEADGASLAYACDHEPHCHDLAVGEAEITGQDLSHAEFLSYADLVIHDAQYTPEEYGHKAGWGHSTPGYATRICCHGEVSQLALTHHDPVRIDTDIDRIVATTKKNDLTASDKLKIFAAADGQQVSLPKRHIRPAVRKIRDAEDVPYLQPKQNLILLAVHSAAKVVEISKALEPDEFSVKVVTSASDLCETLQGEAPALIVFEEQGSPVDLAEVCGQLKSSKVEFLRPIPIVVLSADGQSALSEKSFVEVLTEPYSGEYLRTRISTALLRYSGQKFSDRTGPSTLCENA